MKGVAAAEEVSGGESDVATVRELMGCRKTQKSCKEAKPLRAGFVHRLRPHLGKKK